MRKSFGLFFFTAALLAVSSPVFAETAPTATSGSGRVWFYTSVALATLICMMITAVGAGWAQSKAVRTAVEGIARNPGAATRILPAMLVGIAMIESLAIYVLVIALILLFSNPFLKFL